MDETELVPENGSRDGVVAEQAEARTEKPVGLKSWTHCGLHVVGWLLVVCFFLPTARGCSGKLIYPVEAVTEIDTARVQSILTAVVWVGSYWNHALAACVITACIVLGSKASLRKLTILQFVLGMLITAAILLVILFSDDSVRSKLRGILSMLPLTVLPAFWIGVAWRRGEFERMWGRMQFTWSVAALVSVHVQCVFSPHVLVGYWLAVVALALSVFFIEASVRRMDHDWFDGNQPARRFQFSIAQLFLWLTFGPLVFGYYQAIDPVVDFFLPLT